MEQKLTPLEIARQTLIKLSKSQIPPTPANYSRVYDEIAGTKSTEQSTILDKSLEKVLLDLGKNQPKFVTTAKKISTLVEKKDIPNLELQLKTLFSTDAKETDGINWGTLLRYLLKQLEVNHTGVTLSRKKEGLNRVIINFGNDPSQLSQKIQALIASWGDGQANIEVVKNVEPASADAITLQSSNVINHATVSDDSKKQLALAWRDMLIRTINLIVIPQFQGIPSAIKRVEELIKKAEDSNTLEDVNKINDALKSTLLRAEMQSDAQHRMQEALIEILRLLVSSMGELTIEDQWLHAQITIVQDIISKPLKIDTIYNAESSLKELIFKQSHIKPGVTEAKETLRSMVSTFVSRLAEITINTGTYQKKIEHYQEQISSTDDISQLSNILESLVGDIAEMSTHAKQNHDALQETQKKVELAEKQINELTVKLDYISEAAHEDFLTGALNRRGMDDALIREFERADRHGTALSVAMLDIDHFKKINDTLGHSTGDRALAHLAKVVKGILRSTDVLARYGGEEFVILLPGSKQEDALNVVTGLQRELTKNFFLHNNERVLITFSAGVAERVVHEDVESVLPRADAALYLAKQSGRNRVIGASPAQDNSLNFHI